MAQKITHWLLIALILSLGFGQLLRFQTLWGTFYIHDVLVISLLCLNGHRIKSVPWSLKILLVGLLLGWLRALTLYPLSLLLIPSLYSLRLLAYLALYLALKQSKVMIRKIHFLISGAITGAIGIGQYLLMPDMRIFQYLGWDDHLNRLTLPHFDPTFTAIMLTLVFLLVPLKNWFVSTLFILPILLTYSRSAWLSLVLTGFLFIKNKLLLFLACVLLLLAIFALPKRFGEGTNLLRTFSIESRAAHDISIARNLGWNLVTGVGMNTFSLNSISEKGDPNHASGPNNSYLYLLATSGILGLVGFLLFIRGVSRASHYKPMIIFILIASCFNNALFYPFALLWILLTQFMVPSEV